MNAERQRQIFDRKTRRLERKYNRLIQEAILRQLVIYQRALRSNTIDAIYSIDKYFDDTQLSNVYAQMIEEAANEFRIDDFDQIIKAINASTWVTFVTQRIANEGGRRITQINRFTKAYVLSRLRPILNQGVEDGLGIADIATAIISNIGEYAGRFARYRAERIARTEIIGTSNWAGLASAQAAGIEDQVRKRWISAFDERTRQTHIDMENHPAIGLNEKFEVPKLGGGFDLMSYPGDPAGSAENVINCRCTIIYERV
jgi:hypothetical protein